MPHEDPMAPFERPDTTHHGMQAKEQQESALFADQQPSAPAQTITPDTFQHEQEKVQPSPTQTATTLPTAVKQPTTTLSTSRALTTSVAPSIQLPFADEVDEEIFISLPHPTEFTNASYIKNVGNFFFKWLGLFIGNGGQVITSTTTALIALYQSPVNFLPRTYNPVISFLIYLIIRLVLALIVATVFQSVVALAMIYFIDDFFKILNLHNNDRLSAFLIFAALVVITLFTLGANFYSDATIMHYITTSVLMISLLTGILTLCSAGATTMGRIMRNYGKNKLDFLYGQSIQYYQLSNLSLPADVQEYLDMQTELQSATGLKRLRYNLFS